MNPDLLTEALHERASATRVGPPPLERIHRDATRRRRGGTAMLAAAVAVVMVSVGIAVWDRAVDEAPGPAHPDPTRTDRPAPTGTRYVGLDRVVVAIPDDWTPHPTGICGPGGNDDEIRYYPPTCNIRAQSGVTVYRHELSDTDGWDDIEVDGEPALYSGVSVDEPNGSDFYSGSIYLPGLGTIVSARATDDAELVPQLLDSVAVLHDHAAIPGYRQVNRDFNSLVGTGPRGGPRDASGLYEEKLNDLGIEAEVVRVRSIRRAGWIAAVEPERGSVVPVGSTVIVYVSGGNESP
jgi:hypothetical protein